MERRSWASRDVTQERHQATSQNRAQLQNQMLRKSTWESQERKRTALWFSSPCQKRSHPNSTYFKWVSCFGPRKVFFCLKLQKNNNQNKQRTVFKKELYFLELLWFNVFSIPQLEMGKKRDRENVSFKISFHPTCGENMVASESFSYSTQHISMYPVLNFQNIYIPVIYLKNNKVNKYK